MLLRTQLSLLFAASILVASAVTIQSLNRTSATAVSSPYVPRSGWIYAIEGIRSSPWPSCPYRFISCPETCDGVDLWRAVGSNQFWRLESASSTDPSIFFVRANCGSYLSYPSDCGVDKVALLRTSVHYHRIHPVTQVDLWPSAGVNQMFQFTPSQSIDDGSMFQYNIAAVGRSACSLKFLSFPVSCSTQSPDLIDLWDAVGPEQTFRLFPIAAPHPHEIMPNTEGPCADPFIWLDPIGAYFIVCTAPNIALYSANGTLSSSLLFTFQGSALSGIHPTWASSPNMWAPEVASFQGKGSAMFFADTQAQDIACEGTSPSDGSHRIGWVLDIANRSLPGHWDVFSNSYLCLGPTQGGDIDPHIFTDSDGSRYLVWKSDDNRLGLPTTHIWAVQVNISSLGVSLIGQPRVLLDSTELWWAAVDYIQDGYLIEGPEIVYRDPYYYLFFAAASYCSVSYSEGVARSKNFWGPYEKLHIPFLSTGLVGSVNGSKLIGPGHASFIQSPGADRQNGWVAVWHASFPGDICVRTAFVTPLNWGVDNWPYVDV